MGQKKKWSYVVAFISNSLSRMYWKMWATLLYHYTTILFYVDRQK
jgi:hypothetical protein